MIEVVGHRIAKTDKIIFGPDMVKPLRAVSGRSIVSQLEMVKYGVLELLERAHDPKALCMCSVHPACVILMGYAVDPPPVVL